MRPSIQAIRSNAQIYAHNVSLAGSLLSGEPLGISDIPGLQLELDNKVNRSGDNMSGLLTLSAAPTVDLHAATKKYVDDSVTSGGGYTDEQAQDATATLIQNGTGITWSYNDTANTLTPTITTTKSDIGLGNVDNTSDANKPVSTAQASAIAVVQTDINTHEARIDNPHSVTKTQVGLSNVDNTSDLAKPISTATQTALDGKADDSDLTAITLDSLSDVNTAGVLTGQMLRFNGTSWVDGIGINDSATAERFKVENTTTTYGGVAQPMTFKHASDSESCFFSGGIASNSGGNIILYGASHATPSKVSIRRDATDYVTITSAGMDFPQTTTAITQAVGDNSTKLATTAYVTNNISTTGTWTPVLTCATPGNLNVVYSQQVGTYIKIGSTVWVTVRIATSTFTHTTASGVVRITGLPFAVGAFSWNALGRFSGITQANYTQFGLRAASGASYLQLDASGQGQAMASVSITNLPTAGTIEIGGQIMYTV